MEDAASSNARQAMERAARDVGPDLLRHLKTRYRLVPDKDDLVQQTLLDLQRYLLNRGDFVDPSEVRALAFTIVKRRAMDRFRAEAKAYAELLTAPAEEATAPSAETVASGRQMLSLVLGFISQMPSGDRDLLLDAAAPGGHRAPMSVMERKKLSRLRMRLRELLVQAPKENNEKGGNRDE